MKYTSRLASAATIHIWPAERYSSLRVRVSLDDALSFSVAKQ